jgi:hypothetical protein
MLSMLSQLLQTLQLLAQAVALLELSILSQFLPRGVEDVDPRHRKAFSILSQLLPYGFLLSRSAVAEQRASFQFFPSCCKFAEFFSKVVPSGDFQFFPSCCRGSGALHPYKPFFRQLRSS